MLLACWLCARQRALCYLRIGGKTDFLVWEVIEIRNTERKTDCDECLEGYADRLVTGTKVRRNEVVGKSSLKLFSVTTLLLKIFFCYSVTVVPVFPPLPSSTHPTPPLPQSVPTLCLRPALRLVLSPSVHRYPPPPSPLVAVKQFHVFSCVPFLGLSALCLSVLHNFHSYSTLMLLPSLFFT